MQTAILVTLCLGIFLPRILGQEDCTCKFPNYLSGKAGDAVSFHFDIPAQLLQMDYLPLENGAQVFDLKNRVLYYNYANSCEVLQISSQNERYYKTIPPQCVPKGAMLQSTVEDNVRTYQNKRSVVDIYNIRRNVTFSYKVRMTGSDTCMPISITIDGATAFNNFVKDTAKEIDFYEKSVNAAGKKCNLDAIKIALG